MLRQRRTPTPVPGRHPIARKSEFSSRYLWYALSLLFAANLFNYMDRMVISVVLPLIKADLDLSDTQLGVLTGIAFAVFYATFGIPIARWADRGTRRTIVSLAIAVWSAMTVLCGMAQNFFHLMLARFGVGIGEAGCVPPSHSMISDYFPTERRATALGIHTAGATLGIVAGLVLGGYIAETWGWRWAFFMLGAPGLLLAILTRLTLREPTRGAHEEVAVGAPQPPLGEVLRYFARRRSYVHLVIVFAMGSFAAFGIQMWLPSFYVRSFGMSTAEVGFYFGIAFGLGSAIGTLGGGYVADFMGKGDMRRPLLILGVGASAMTLPLSLGVLLAPWAALALTFNLVSSTIGGLANGPLFAAIQSVVDNRMRAMAVAILMFSSSMIGVGLGPLFAGMLSDVLAPRFGDDSLRYSLIILSCLGVYPIVHLWLAVRALPRDAETTAREARQAGADLEATAAPAAPAARR